MIRDKAPNKELVIDLTGPDGNAFVLLATAKRLANKMGLDWDEICTEMKSGGYENLINTFDKVFGDYVILER